MENMAQIELPFRSWTIIGTRPLANALGLDRCAFNMRVYRNKGPLAVSREWLKGTSVGYFGWAVRQWLRDPRTLLEMLRDDLVAHVGEGYREDPEDHLWMHAVAAASCTETTTAGVKLSRKGWAAYRSGEWAAKHLVAI